VIKAVGIPLAAIDEVPATSPAERSAVLSQRIAAIYSNHGEAVARWVLRLGGPSFDGADAVQEVFAVVAERLPTFRGESKLATWLYGITENVVRQLRRRERVRRWFFGVESERIDPPAAGPQPLEVIEQRQSNEQVYRALDRLREPYRSALILFELEGLSGQEIAELKGCNVATVWVWLHRARAQFLKQLDGLRERP
jgi:RNA polymerase sigma-70 factor (ECF subfamily)